MNSLTQVKINITGQITNIDGSIAKYQEADLTMKAVLLKALLTLFDGDQNLPLESRAFRIALAKEVHSQDTISLTLSDVVTLSSLIARNFSHPIVLASFLEVVDAAIFKPTTD